jgi:hypothetical protein
MKQSLIPIQNLSEKNMIEDEKQIQNTIQLIPEYIITYYKDSQSKYILYNNENIKYVIMHALNFDKDKSSAVGKILQKGKKYSRKTYKQLTAKTTKNMMVHFGTNISKFNLYDRRDAIQVYRMKYG